MISTNESYRDIAITRSGKDPADVTVVRTGPDPDKLQRGTPDEGQKRGRRHLASYIGVMGPQDGVDIVVRAAGVIVHDLGRTDIAFTLIGKGDCFDELVALRDELKLNGYVEFTGRAPDELVKKVMSTADIGLSPDPMNPLNDVSTMNKTMEYMSFELPVVAFDLRETRVSAADAAVYVKPTGRPEQDVRDYAQAIVDLIDNPDERARMGKLGRARVEQELAWPHQRQAYLTVYAELAPLARKAAALQAGANAYVRYRRVLPAGRRAQADRRHDRADRAPRSGRGRAVEPRGRARLYSPRPPAAVDHRPVHVGQPAAGQGRPDARL